MITAGIDIGSLNTKTAIVRDREILGLGISTTGDNGNHSATISLKKALTAASVENTQVDRNIFTGAGKGDAQFEGNTAPETICDVKGVLFYFPTARSVIDMGAENTRVVKCANGGRVLDFNTNDKCAAGTGVFLDTIAKALEVALEDMGPISLTADKETTISSTCTVFAESEVVGLIAKSTDKASILMAIHKSIADRIYGQIRRVGVGQPMIFVGGGARNIGIVRCVEERIQKQILVPDKPEFIGAIGAALIAQERSSSA